MLKAEPLSLTLKHIKEECHSMHALTATTCLWFIAKLSKLCRQRGDESAEEAERRCATGRMGGGGQAGVTLSFSNRRAPAEDYSL